MPGRSVFFSKEDLSGSTCLNMSPNAASFRVGIGEPAVQAGRVFCPAEKNLFCLGWVGLFNSVCCCRGISARPLLRCISELISEIWCRETVFWRVKTLARKVVFKSWRGFGDKWFSSWYQGLLAARRLVVGGGSCWADGPAKGSHQETSHRVHWGLPSPTLWFPQNLHRCLKWECSLLFTKKHYLSALGFSCDTQGLSL